MVCSSTRCNYITLWLLLCGVKYPKVQIVVLFCIFSMLLIHFIPLVRPKFQDTIYVKTPRVAEELDPRISPVVKVIHAEQDVRIFRRSIELSHLQVKSTK